MLDLRIDGGLVATLHGEATPQSVGIAGGQIVAVGDLREVAAREVLDVHGSWVVPGAIDTHVHLGFTDEDREWDTETRSAVIGGVTTGLVYFRSLDRYTELLPEFISQGERDSHMDFGVHLGILHDEHLADFERLVDAFGLRSIKMYTTYKSGELARYGVLGQDDGLILDVMRRAAAHEDVLVHVHCENDDITLRGEQHFGQDVDDPAERWSQMRPPLAEVEAIRRIALLARDAGARMLVPHVSSERALAAALAEQAAGARLHIETCPHYLLAPVAAARGTLAKVNPPVRPGENGDTLWSGLRDGTIDVVGTDHACLMRADKTGDRVEDVRPGFPGMGTLLPILMDGVVRGRLSLADYARLTARAAALFELPRHGHIAPGRQADVVVVDPGLRRPVDPAALASLSDFSPYEGEPLAGWPVITVARGRVVAREGEIVAEPGGGYVRQVRQHVG